MKLLTAALSIALAFSPLTACAETTQIAFVVGELGSLQAVTYSTASKSVIGCDNGIADSPNWNGVKVAYIIPDQTDPVCGIIAEPTDEQVAQLSAACKELANGDEATEVFNACEQRFTSVE